MRKIDRLDCVLLVDDDFATNYFHKLVIEKAGIDTHVQVVENGRDALDYITCSGKFKESATPLPGIIFLDINMPRMNGWEFLEEYRKLPQELKAKIVMAMVTTSLNPADEKKAHNNKDLIDFISKPLTLEKFEEIVSAHFTAQD
jgi:CheY-like chemotaxis protein